MHVCSSVPPQLETFSKTEPCYGRLIILMNHQKALTHRIVAGDPFRLSSSLLDKLDLKFQSGLVPHMPRSTHANKGLLQVNLGQVEPIKVKPFWHHSALVRGTSLETSLSNPCIATIHKCYDGKSCILRQVSMSFYICVLPSMLNKRPRYVYSIQMYTVDSLPKKGCSGDCTNTLTHQCSWVQTPTL